MASFISVPPKIYTLNFPKGGQGQIATKELMKLNEFLLKGCGSAEIILSTTSIRVVEELHALLVNYRSQRVLFEHGTSTPHKTYTPQEADEILAKIKDDNTVDAWRIEMKEQSAAMTKQINFPSSNWCYPNLPWVSGEDRDEDVDVDSLTRLTNRYDKFFENNKLTDEKRGPAVHMLGILKSADMYERLRRYLLEVITCPEDITDILDGYAMVCQNKDAWLSRCREVDIKLHYSSYYSTAMLARFLILYTAIVRNDYKRRMWQLRRENRDLDDMHTIEGYAMTWEQFSDAIAASTFFKEKQYNNQIEGVSMHGDTYVILETPVIGGICESIITAATVARVFGPIALPANVTSVEKALQTSGSVDDKEFWEALLVSIKDGLELDIF